MTINPHIFRSYDIRGIAGTDLTPEGVTLIGKGFGTYIQEKIGGKRVVVGRDCRISSPEYAEKFIEGLISTGCEVINIGLAPSPLTYFASCRLNVDAGVSITASHNPKEYNGFKFVKKNAHSICGDDLQEIRTIIESQKFCTGNGSVTENNDIFNSYQEKINSMIDIKKKLKVVVDAGNGIAGPFAKRFFESLGCEVICLYCEPDGNFPNHEANPEEYENMVDLIAAVKNHNADIGFGFDGDADRVGVIDEKGNHYHADKILLLLARDLLSRHPQAKIVHDIKCSKVLENDIIDHGGIPVMCKTGHSHIENKMHEEGALLGGEVSGHMFFGENYYGFDDAFLAAAKILEILGSAEVSFSQLLSGLPIMFNTPEIKAGCPDNEKFNIVQELTIHFERDYECITLDGVRMHFDEESWGIVRCSNTSPNLTLRFEAPNEERLKEIIDIVAEKLKEYPQISLEWYNKFK